MTAQTTTKHTCGGPIFGRKTPGCPRCDELLAGAPAVQWAPSRREQDEQDAHSRRAHYSSARHNDPAHPSYCGSVCTFGDW
jgi:hypothetical protein